MCSCIHVCSCVYASMCSCVYVSMCPCVHVSMRPCVHVFMCSAWASPQVRTAASQKFGVQPYRRTCRRHPGTQSIYSPPKHILVLFRVVRARVAEGSTPSRSGTLTLRASGGKCSSYIMGPSIRRYPHIRRYPDIRRSKPLGAGELH